MGFRIANSRIVVLVLLILLLVVTFSYARTNDDQYIVAGPVPRQPDFEHRLVVKFRDNIRARSRAGKLSSQSAAANRFGNEITDIHSANFYQLIQMDGNQIADFEARALSTSGRWQPDLASMMIVEAPEDALQNIANQLHTSEFVEWVEFEMINPEPPIIQECDDISPATPDYESFQGFRGPNPGLNMDAFWELGNARGAGIKLADCEYWFNEQHEDNCGVTSEPGQTPDPGAIENNFHQHGTAVLGTIIGGDNAFGILGLAPDVDPYFFPEWTIEGGFRRVTAIANAVATMDPGDIVLLEMQTSIGFGFGPAELSLPVWNVVRVATDAGVIVVAAAGNGDQDLDSPNYASYLARGDSGAILVGAGNANTAHNKLSFSTFGSRVDVQGWGQSVFTAGYGNFAVIGGDENQNYTSGFNGTSSASALLAAVCVSLQSYAEAEIGRRLTSYEMRQVLRETGWPQGMGGHIGRFPNMLEAGERIVNFAPGNNDFFDRTEITNLPVSIAADNLGATAQDGEQNLENTGATVWWTIVAPETGIIHVDLEGSAIDTQLQIYSGGEPNILADLVPVAFNDDEQEMPHSVVRFPVNVGQRYEIRVGSAIAKGTTLFTGDISMAVDFTPAGPVDFFWSSRDLDSGTVNNSNASGDIVAGSSGSLYLYCNPLNTEIDSSAFLDILTSTTGVIEFTLAETLDFEITATAFPIGLRWGDEVGETGDVSPNFIDEIGARSIISGFGMVLQVTGPVIIDQGYDVNAEAFLFARVDFDVVGKPGSSVNIITNRGSRRIVDQGESLDPIIGSFTLNVVDSAILLGDINCDGNIDLLDVEPFVDLLVSGSFSPKADFNDDGSVSLLDVGPFVELLRGG